MFLELLLFTLLGCGLGMLTGMIPGLHVNTISILLLGVSYFINPYGLAVAIISMAITHTLFDFIPSIFLGAPEPSTALSVLPGHRFLLASKGLQALYLTLIGGVGAVFITMLLFPLFVLLIPLLYQSINAYIHIILLGIALIMIASERSKKKLYGLLVFFLSGMLGLILLNSYMLPSGVLLFPIFTGLFGISTMLISLNMKIKIPKQITKISKIPRKIALSGIFKGLFSGALLGVLPGVGAAQATVLTQQITKRKSDAEFLISIGAINTIVALFSLISLYTIMRPRSGAAVAVQQVLTSFGFNDLLLLLAAALIATGISAIVLLKTMRRMVLILQKFNYKKLTMLTIAFLLILTFIFSGFLGLFILFVSTSIGLLAPLFGVKRSLSMGVLMLPLIFFYAGVVI